MPYKDLYDLRVFLYESGSVLSDVLIYKQVMATAAATFQNEKQFKTLITELRESLLPELSGNDTKTEDMSDLMKELENTIVVIDKKSFNK